MGTRISGTPKLIAGLGERLRERMSRLEALAPSTKQDQTVEKPPVAGPDSALSPYGNPIHIVGHSLPTYHASDASVSSSSVATPREDQQLIAPSDDTLSLNMWDYTTLASHSDDLSSSPCIWNSTSQAPRPNDTSVALSIWGSPTYIDPSLLVSDKHSNDHDPYWTTTIECGCSSPHVQIRTQGPNSFRYGGFKILQLAPGAPSADPYANNLRIETVCNITALRSIGMHIGVSEEMLCADESFSPFFRSSAHSTDELAKSNMIGAVQRIFKTLKPDLRPSREQITVQHHPYIDILPFPTLRKNLITRPGEFDEDEFFHDIITGLVCWGGAGLGRRDRQESTGFASSGTPWDVRSWEARVWFLKKYWRLLGGEDGELVRQSEWWRGIRGDDDALDVEGDD
ncbi:hypothetical protein BO70DRAFT_362679 [Aspergillus heteromorphus CBS 117.55]|uniref:Uncharacterized protein n=1 Tax=Aspergillus heteromorphus CBS 117.55 TaxID=1448321 RepID=A0A317W5Y8_9EURO|nr:uncharacterized protein BO70DRAFT_362679 [Aspergillus heteromorphus CBS 117.55]PWY80722.1 hypothetical protein BO70DRAFT_362679 [Aspergillus heteromorphus CBS 117.55]